MREDDKLKQKYGTEPGFKVPDGYFEHVYASISEQLPEHPATRKRAPLSRWTRLKPYVYLAAMFGGIWCTMKMVSMISQTHTEPVSLDNPPELVAQAMSSPEVVAQAYTAPTVMAVDDETFPIDEPQSSQTGNSDEPGDISDLSDGYVEYVNAADIDLSQLQAALYSDDSSDDDYYYYI